MFIHLILQFIISYHILILEIFRLYSNKMTLFLYYYAFYDVRLFLQYDYSGNIIRSLFSYYYNYFSVFFLLYV